MRIGLNLVQQLLRTVGKSVPLAGQLCFSVFLRGWRLPSRQHDCAEFLHHLIPKFGAGLFRGGWEARRAEALAPADRGGCVIVESGSCDQAITVVSIRLSTFSMNGTSKLMYMHSRKRHRSFCSVFQDTGGLTECRDVDNAASPGNPWCAFRCSGDLTLSSQAPLLMKSLQQSCTLVTRRRWDTVHHCTVQLQAGSGTLHCDNNSTPKFSAAADYANTVFQPDDVYLLVCRRGNTSSPVVG